MYPPCIHWNMALETPPPSSRTNDEVQSKVPPEALPHDLASIGKRMLPMDGHAPISVQDRGSAVDRT